MTKRLFVYQWNGLTVFNLELTKITRKRGQQWGRLRKCKLTVKKSNFSENMIIKTTVLKTCPCPEEIPGTQLNIHTENNAEPPSSTSRHSAKEVILCRPPVRKGRREGKCRRLEHLRRITFIHQLCSPFFLRSISIYTQNVPVTPSLLYLHNGSKDLLFTLALFRTTYFKEGLRCCKRWPSSTIF